jgi:hypothetical protein
MEYELSSPCHGCEDQIIATEVVWLRKPIDHHVRMNLLVSADCMRSTIEVIDLNGKGWRPKSISLLDRKVSQDFHEKCCAAWKDASRRHFIESVELLRSLTFKDMSGFRDRCSEIEIYINNMSTMDVEIWMGRGQRA